MISYYILLLALLVMLADAGHSSILKLNFFFIFDLQRQIIQIEKQQNNSRTSLVFYLYSFLLFEIIFYYKPIPKKRFLVLIFSD